MHWTTMTLEQLKAATVGEILKNVGQYIAANYTKRQIITWLLLDDTEAKSIPDKVVVTKDDQKRVVKRVEVDRDPETGIALGGRVTTWQYFATGEIRYIVISDRDAENVETRKRTIQHYRDGRQPVVSEQIQEEIPAEVTP